ncbi:MAG: response regulator [Methylovulum sp.]|nr:response regulator [Methylovulum sp.]
MTIKNILWLDDKIENYKPFIEGLAKFGMLVSEANSVDIAIDLAKNRKFDLFLVDLRMPDRSGFDALTELRKIAPDTSTCILSSYLHLDEYQKKLSSLGRTGHKVAVLDKDLPDPSGPAFASFAKNILNFIESPPKYTPKQFEDKLINADINPFDVPFHKYLNYPNRIKKYLREKAEEKAKQTLISEFQSGKVWVLLCGNSDEPVLTADKETQIPDSDTIIRKSMELDRAPVRDCESI